MPDYERSNSGRELIGLIVIVIGFGLLMNTMGIFPMFPFFSYIHRFWLPALFIGIGALLLSRRGSYDSPLPGLFFVVFGLVFFMGSLGPWNGSYRRWVGPAILIWIGVMFLTKNSRTRWHRRERYEPQSSFGPQQASDSRPSTDSSDFIQASAFLGGFSRRCSSQQFRGGDITAFMGGGKIDLRDARIQGNEAVLDIFAMMGGIEIEIPRDWVVELHITPILGGYEDKTNPQNQGSQRLIIHGTAIMSGVTVKS